MSKELEINKETEKFIDDVYDLVITNKKEKPWQDLSDNDYIKELMIIEIDDLIQKWFDLKKENK